MEDNEGICRQEVGRTAHNEHISGVAIAGAEMAWPLGLVAVTRNSVEWWRRRISGYSGYPQVGRGSGSGRSMPLQHQTPTQCGPERCDAEHSTFRRRQRRSHQDIMTHLGGDDVKLFQTICRTFTWLSA